MIKDRLLGPGRQMLGSAKQVVGKLLGDAKLEVGGKTNQANGKIQNSIGSAKDTLQR